MTSPAADPYSRKLGDLLLEQDRRLARLESGQRASQLGNSSIEDDYIRAYDAQGQARQRLGRLTDGTFGIQYVNGPKPPRPSNVNIAAGQLAIIVSWDGSFEGNVGRPGDFLRLDIHRSEEEGFEYTEATAVASLHDPGVVAFFSDSDTKYIKVVAVNTSKVPSDPTDELAILPLPADQIAVGAIGAEQLAALIVLANLIIVGDPNAARIEINGTTNELSVYAPDGSTQTFLIDGDTGDVVHVGTFKTAHNGERIEISSFDGGSKMHWYPAGAVGEERSEIYQFGDQLVMRGLFSGVGESSFMFLTPDAANISYGEPSVAQKSHIFATPTAVSIQAAESFIRSDQRVGIGGAVRTIRLSQLDTNGDDIPGSILNHRITTIASDTFPRLSAPTPGSSLAFAYGDLWSQSTDGGAHRRMHASAFTVESGSDSKEDITDFEDDSLAVIKNANVKRWRRREEPIPEDTEIYEDVGNPDNPSGRPVKVRPRPTPPRRYHVSPLAGDLPDTIKEISPMTGTEEVDLFDFTSYAWDGISKLADKLEALSDKIDAISARLSALERG